MIPSSVTSIGRGALDFCRSLTSIKIPSGVTSIGNYAFEKCSSLARIYVSWETPVSITSNVFYNVDKQKCTLYVPQGTYQDYLNAVVWGDFANIVEYDAAGIEDMVSTTDLKEVSRYSVNGQQLTAPTKGVNIVKYSDGSVRKIAVQ